MHVDDYLDAATRRPWIYGGGPGGFRGHDCTLFPANWCLAQSGRDPADDLRETYSTREEAVAILVRAGGYFGLMAARLVSSGWRFVDRPQCGDIGIVDINLPSGSFRFPGIRRGNHWMVADPRRLVALAGDLPCSTIWRPA